MEIYSKLITDYLTWYYTTVAYTRNYNFDKVTWSYFEDEGTVIKVYKITLTNFDMNGLNSDYEVDIALGISIFNLLNFMYDRTV